jgi:hypothetical protein
MRSSRRLFERLFFRYNGGTPQALDMTGKTNLDIVKMIKAELSPIFDRYSVSEIQVWKPDGKEAAEISYLNLSDHQTEDKALILRLQPKTVKIDTGSGCIMQLEIFSENHFGSFLADEGARGLISPTGARITTVFDLIDGGIYSLPKTITIHSFEPALNSEITDTRTFYSQSELTDYLSKRNLLGIFTSKDSKTLENFDSIRSQEMYYGALKEQSIEETIDGWIKNEAVVMEEEALIASKAAITKLLEERNLDSVLIDKQREFIKGSKKQKILEWDGIFHAPANDTLYLIECKHSMKPHLLFNIAERRNKFIAKLQKSGFIDEINFKSSYGNIVAIACSGDFPERLRKKAEEFGLLTLVPSGDRYIPGSTWTLDAKTTRKP